jgi:integrase
LLHMARVALPKMTPTAEGGWTARKRIPADVQDAYEKVYRVRWEERFNSGAVPLPLAREKLTAWTNDMEARIKNIRAEQKGEGRTLSPMQARALAGDWYLWWTARHLAKPSPVAHWNDFRGRLIDRAWAGAEDVGDRDAPDWNPAAVWDQDYDAREPARAMAADYGETSQFLHSKRLTLEPAARELFLDYLCRDMFDALDLLMRRAKGDYSEDTHPKEFPKFERTADPGLTAWTLFERWVTQMGPATSTVDRWRAVFLKLQEDFPNHSAATFTSEEVKAWLDGLITGERTARTVNDVWRVAGRRVFGWAADQRLINHNPFADVKVPVPRKRTNRETKAFTDDEIKIILKALLALSKPQLKKGEALRRWVPWICAYTGARSGEITQLRGTDVIEQKGVHAIRITPEAGSVKAGRPRTVPLHAHLLEQGILEFVKVSGKGPLFYNEPKSSPKDAEEDITNPRKPRYVKAREHLAKWVRDLGVTDPEVKPNHAWRETFKQIRHRYEISERILDAIAGHAPISVGRGYGLPTLADMAAALKKFPRYEVE